MKTSSTLLLFSLLLLAAESCKKDNNNPPPPSHPTISAISPDSGAYNTVVTITGRAFNANAAEDSVKFNGTAAVIQSATDTTLVVKVTQGSGTGPVTIIVHGDTAIGPVFNYQSIITVSTFAGGTPGSANGMGAQAQFSEPAGVAVDGQGNVYVADYLNYSIREINPSGLVSTIAGNGKSGFVDGSGTTAEFSGAMAVAVDAQENIYVVDGYNQRVRKITPAGIVSTLAGNGTAGYVDGPGNLAEFNYPSGIAVDAAGNVYIGDTQNERVRKITPSGTVSTLAGNGTIGITDGVVGTAEFDSPTGLVLDAAGNVYVADYEYPGIRKISPSGTVSTLAGNGMYGTIDGPGNVAEFNNPNGLAIDAKGNIYVADEFNSLIREITPSGIVSTLAGIASGWGGYKDGLNTVAEFNFPYGVAVDAQGNVYVADYYNNAIRKITIQ
jgi:sugar lactone lactonase YvrE